MLTQSSIVITANALDDLGLSNDPFDSNKSRKSSGFSSSNDSKERSRQYSGYDMQSAANKSRNCSGNSITAGLVESGILAHNGTGTAPVMIPGSGNISPKTGSPLKSGGGQNGGQNGHNNELGLFDLTSNSNSNNSASEAARLKEELLANRQRMANWEESLQRAQKACEVWKNEATIAARKAELAVREKEAAMLKLAQMQKEIDTLSGGPHLHAVRRVQDLKSAPMGVLKTLDWQLRKDLQEVEKVRIFSYSFL